MSETDQGEIPRHENGNTQAEGGPPVPSTSGQQAAEQSSAQEPRTGNETTGGNLEESNVVVFKKVGNDTVPLTEAEIRALNQTTLPIPANPPPTSLSNQNMTGNSIGSFSHNVMYNPTGMNPGHQVTIDPAMWFNMQQQQTMLWNALLATNSPVAGNTQGKDSYPTPVPPPIFNTPGPTLPISTPFHPNVASTPFTGIPQLTRQNAASGNELRKRFNTGNSNNGEDKTERQYGQAMKHQGKGKSSNPYLSRTSEERNTNSRQYDQRDNPFESNANQHLGDIRDFDRAISKLEHGYSKSAKPYLSGLVRDYNQHVTVSSAISHVKSCLNCIENFRDVSNHEIKSWLDRNEHLIEEFKNDSPCGPVDDKWSLFFEALGLMKSHLTIIKLRKAVEDGEPSGPTFRQDPGSHDPTMSPSQLSASMLNVVLDPIMKMQIKALDNFNGEEIETFMSMFEHATDGLPVSQRLKLLETKLGKNYYNRVRGARSLGRWSEIRQHVIQELGEFASDGCDSHLLWKRLNQGDRSLQAYHDDVRRLVDKTPDCSETTLSIMYLTFYVDGLSDYRLRERLTTKLKEKSQSRSTVRNLSWYMDFASNAAHVKKVVSHDGEKHEAFAANSRYDSKSSPDELFPNSQCARHDNATHTNGECSLKPGMCPYCKQTVKNKDFWTGDHKKVCPANKCGICQHRGHNTANHREDKPAERPHRSSYRDERRPRHRDDRHRNDRRERHHRDDRHKDGHRSRHSDRKHDRRPHFHKKGRVMAADEEQTRSRSPSSSRSRSMSRSRSRSYSRSVSRSPSPEHNE